MALTCSPTRQRLRPEMGWVERVCAVGWDVAETGCWEWRGYRLPNGRARIAWRGKRKYPYRITYEAVHGPIPEGLVACHTCDNSSCVNPDHIVPGTQQENIDMMTVPGAQKITPGEVESLRIDYMETDLTQQELADKYGVSKTTVTRAVAGIYRRGPRSVA